MQRKYAYAACVVGVLAGCAALWQFNRGQAHDGDPIVGKMATTVLPISQVVLFNSGVGYVQREGEVTGDGDEVTGAAADGRHRRRRSSGPPCHRPRPRHRRADVGQAAHR